MGKYRFHLVLLVFFLFLTQTTEAQLVPLDQWIKTFRLSFEYFEPYQEFLLRKKSGQMARFGVLTEYTWLEKQGFVKTGPLVKVGKQYFLPQGLYKVLRQYFEDVDSIPVKPQIMTIILDPGHGGKDFGTLAAYKKEGKIVQVVEKNVVLDIAKRIERKLAKILPETNVILTRDKDIYLSLEQRVQMANDNKPEFPHELIFISIHANFSPYNKKAQGFEVWRFPDEIKREVAPLLDENFHQNWEILNSFLNLRYKKESRRLAKSISEAYDQKFSKQNNRGLKQESWFVVKNSYVPAVLVEVGFISSEEEALLLTSDRHLDRLSEVIIQGIKRFVDEYN